MDDTEFEQLLERKYAQVVLRTLLDAEGHNYAFNALLEEVNTIVADDSRGPTEMFREGKYSPASLNSLLSDAKNAGITDQYLDEDGNVRWRLCTSQLSQSQINKIRSKTNPSVIHGDSASMNYYSGSHTDFSSS